MGSYPKITPIIATGSSAPRYLGDRFADIVNLKDFGAKGDGETDDSTAWAAWNTALQSGGTPFIPKGDYLVSNKLIHVPNGHIRCNMHMPFDGSVEYDSILDTFSCSVYVDEDNGDDDNDGLTPNTPVASIVKGISIADGSGSEITYAISGGDYTPTHLKRIYIASGTYTERVAFSGGNYLVNMLGDVNINGCFNIDKSNVRINNASLYTLSVYGEQDGLRDPVNILENSSLVCTNCVLNITAKNQQNGILISDFSRLAANNSVSITKDSSSSGGTGLIVQQNAQAFLQDLLYITKTSGSSAFNKSVTVSLCSYLYVKDGVQVLLGSANGMVLSRNSAALIKASTNSILFSSTNGNAAVAVMDHGTLIIDSSQKVTFRNSTFAQLQVENSSYVHIVGPGNNPANVVEFLGDAVYEIVVSRLSGLHITGIQIYFFGTPTTTSILLMDNAVFYRAANAYPVTGTIVGSQYSVYRGSVFNVDGAGTNLFPGSVAGTVDTTSYYG